MAVNFVDLLLCQYYCQYFQINLFNFNMTRLIVLKTHIYTNIRFK